MRRYPFYLCLMISFFKLNHDHTFVFVFTPSRLDPPQNDGINLPLADSPPPSNLLFVLVVFSVAHDYFCLGVGCKNIVLRPYKATMCFNSLCFVNHFDGPNDRITSHLTLIAQLAVTSTSNRMLSLTFSWLLCVSPLFGGRLRQWSIFFHCLFRRSIRRS